MSLIGLNIVKQKTGHNIFTVSHSENRRIFLMAAMVIIGKKG